MVNSRKIEDLHLIVAAKCRAFIAACAAHGIDVVITSTFRDAESQNALYAQGRTAPGKKVTNVRAEKACITGGGPSISFLWLAVSPSGTMPKRGQSAAHWLRALDWSGVAGGLDS